MSRPGPAGITDRSRHPDPITVEGAGKRSARSRCCAASTSGWRPAPSSPCWARAAAARPPCCVRSPGSSGRTPAPCTSATGCCLATARSCPRAAPDRHGLPGLGPVPPPERRPERGLRPARAAQRPSRSTEALAMVGLGGLGDRRPAPCRAGSSSGWPWPGPWPPSPACCCSTNRSRTSTPPCGCRCAPRCIALASSASPPCSSPTTRRRRSCWVTRWR